MWVNEASPGEFVLSLDSDALVVNELVSSFGDTLNQTVLFAFNPAILTLAVLNYISLPEVHTHKIIPWKLDGIRMWQHCAQHLKGRSPKVGP
jgi:hypothetical protein